MGYEEDARKRVYRLYNQVMKKFILSHDVIMDESAKISDREVVSETIIIKNEKEAPTTLSKAKEFGLKLDDLWPSDATTPTREKTAETSATQESITVRPKLAWDTATRVKGNTLLPTRTANEYQPRGSGTIRIPGGPLFAEAQFALLAGQEEEPQTLTDALNSKQNDKSRAAWHPEPT